MFRSFLAATLASAALAACAHDAPTAAASPAATPVHAAGSLAIKPLAERKVSALPGGTL